MKIALLSRVSTSKQDNENQILALTEFAAKQGWGIVAQFVDTVTGSGKKSRTQFEKMMQAASRREFDLVLFWKLDRFSREGTRKTLQYLQQLDDWKVGWRSLQEPYFDSAGVFKDVVISIAATLAAQERITISERTKVGLARVVREGRKLGRRPTKVNVDRARELQAEGLGLRGIAQKLGCAVNTLQKNLQAAVSL